MAKKDMHTFSKFKREQKKKEKASEKLARRQGKKEPGIDDNDEPAATEADENKDTD
jgi:hypothetical protein